MGSVTLACNKMAWIKRDTPNDNYSSGDWADGLSVTETGYGLYIGGLALLAYEPVPSNLVYKPIISAEPRCYVQFAETPSSTLSYILNYYSLGESWDESTATYNTVPTKYSYCGAARSADAGGRTQWIAANITNVLHIQRIFGDGLAAAFDYGYNRQQNQIATRYHSNSSLRPYIVVTYSDDNVHLTPSLIGEYSYINPHIAQSFGWTSEASASSSLETPTQTGARLLYKLPGDTAWRVAGTVSGDANTLTIPADTLPVAVELQYKLELTDSGGTTTDSAVKTTCTQDALLTATPSSPAGGSRINETAENLFSWTNTSPNGTNQSGAELQWSTDGSAWSALTTTSSVLNVAWIPADTFPVAATLYWRVRSLNADGVAGAWSSAATFSTVDTVPVATAETPDATIERGNQTIRFDWTVSNESGSAQSSSELQYRIGSSGSWSALATVQGSVTSYTAPANTFTAGTVYWRVRAVNRQNTAGEWSAAISFICVAAPSAPIVSSNSLPQNVISWQVAGQNGFEVELDGISFGPRFGSTKSFAVPEFVQDGSHTARVRVLGQYGLWSDWGSVDFEVLDVPGDAVTLSVSADVDAALSWETESTGSRYFVYRDGVRIGHTDKTQFTDRLTLGAHEWRVANALDDGNVTWSNAVNGVCAVDAPLIAAAAGGEWLSLRLDPTSSCETRSNWSRSSALRHFSGERWPVLELSDFEDYTVTVQTAFLTPAEAAPLEALFGQPVVLKTPGGDAVIGGLTAAAKTRTPLYVAYAFSLSRAAWEEIIDDAES